VVSSSCWLSSVSRRSISSSTTSSRSPCLRCKVLDLGLQAGELARGRDLPGVQPGPVRSILVRTCSTSRSARVCSRLRSPELGFGRHQGVLELDGPGFQGGQLFDLGRPRLRWSRRASSGVQVGQFEQAELDLR